MNLERQFLNIELMIQMQDVKRDKHIHLKLVLPMMESGKEVSVMVMVSKNGQMAPYTKANGKIIELMVRANSLILMVISMKANGSTIKPMDMVYTIILMVLVMRAIGEKISNMAMGKKAGQTVLYMKVNT